MSTPTNVVHFPKRQAALAEGVTFAPVASSERGQAVATLQRNLTTWGFNAGTVDGIYGAKTRAAVAALQTFLGLPQPSSGEFDQETANAVNADYAKWDNLPPYSSLLKARIAATSAVGFPTTAPRLPANSSAPNSAIVQMEPVASHPENTGPSVAQWVLWGLGGVAALAGLYLLFKPSDSSGQVAGHDYFDQDDDDAVGDEEEDSHNSKHNLTQHQRKVITEVGRAAAKELMIDLSNAGATAKELKAALGVETKELLRLRRGEQELTPGQMRAVQSLLRKYIVGLDDDSDMHSDLEYEEGPEWGDDDEES